MPELSGAEGQSRTEAGFPQFLSLVRVVLIRFVRSELIQSPEYFPASVRA